MSNKSVFDVAEFGEQISATIHCANIAGGRSYLSEDMIDIFYASDIEHDDLDYLIDNRLVGMFRRDSDGLPVMESFIIKNLIDAAATDIGGKVYAGNPKTEMPLTHFVQGISIVEYNLDIISADGSRPKCGTFEPVKFRHQRKQQEVTRYVEVLRDVSVSFTIASLRPGSPEIWGMIMNVAEGLGVGAARNHGYGKFTVVSWESSAK